MTSHIEPRMSIITLCVEDMHRSYEFYKNGLGLPTPQDIESPIYFFDLAGTKLAIYPLNKMSEEFPEGYNTKRSGFSGFTIAHNTHTKQGVDLVLQQAIDAGAKLIKPAQDVFWGGYSGYFEDPDGYLWEVAYADSWKFKEDSSLVIE